MKYWTVFLIIFFTNQVYGACKIGQQKFGTSLQTIENKLEGYKINETIPEVQKHIITIFEDVCPDLEEGLALDTNLYYHFIKDRLIAIQLERAESDDLLLFEWARNHFGIVEERNIGEEQQFIQVDENSRVIQLYIEVLPEAVYQSVLIISKEHDDLFAWLAKKEDAMDWENYEDPEPESSKGED